MPRNAKRRLAAALLILLLAVAAFAAARLLRGPSLAIPPLFQIDYLKPVHVNGSVKNVGSSGCGAVCLSMALRFLGTDSGQTPQTLFEEAVLYGDYTGANGISQPALLRMARRHGADGEWVGRDAALLRRALAAGRPVICHMGTGTFSRGGHYILLRAVAADGTARVNDPASEENTASAFPIELILAEAKGEEPFLIVRPADG